MPLWVGCMGHFFWRSNERELYKLHSQWQKRQAIIFDSSIVGSGSMALVVVICSF
jgi:hypothetical protein